MSPLVRCISTCAVVGLLTTTVVAGSPPQNPPADRAAALAQFEQRLGGYVALHRRLEGPLPPSDSSVSGRSSLLASRYLGSAIKAARPNARQGDIFTPAVADLFRNDIVDAMDDGEVEMPIPEAYAERETTLSVHPRVYDSCPDWESNEVPAVLLARLPLLPDDIAYRLVGRDLVLWDFRADLIVDVLPNAIPRASW
jgi:hypothetical protein